MSEDSPERELLATADVAVGQFRCAPTQANFSHAGAITRHCFAFPRRGVWIEHDGARPFVADPTRITLYNPKQVYQRRPLDPVGDHSEWIAVSDAVARDVVALYDRAAAESPSRVFRYAYGPARSDLYLRQRRLYQYVRRRPDPDLLLVEECALSLFASAIADLYQRAGTPSETHAQPRRQHRDIVEDACAYLNRTFTHNHSLRAIARAVGTSVFHLCRIFHRSTGLTLHAYRQHLRLRAALEPLERQDADLLTVALDLGYCGHSHFTAAFRRQFGVVPSKLRDAFQFDAGLRGSLDGGTSPFNRM